MALAHHDTAHGDEAERAQTEFLCAENRRDHDVAAGLQPAIGAQLDPVAQAIEREHLIGLRQAHFPGRTGKFDRCLR